MLVEFDSKVSPTFRMQRVGCHYVQMREDHVCNQENHYTEAQGTWKMPPQCMKLTCPYTR